MDAKAFSFNSAAKYRAGGHFKEKPASGLSLTDQRIMVADKRSHLQATFPDIFADYQNPPLTRDVTVANKAWHIWISTPFNWWQTQLNFALWGASAGCGVSFEDHLQAKIPLLASMFRFHVYYMTRRLLEELRVPLPGDKSHSWYENPFDVRGYKRLCSEFGVSPDTDWRHKLDHGCQGLGSYGTFMEPSGAYRITIEHRAHSSTQKTQSDTPVTFQEPGRPSSSTNRIASRKRVWNVLTTRSARMFGRSWRRKRSNSLNAG